MDRQAILLLFLAQRARTKRQIFGLFQLFEKQYYKGVFDDVVAESELPTFTEGQYGMWSKELTEDLEVLGGLGYVVQSKMTSTNIPGGFTMWNLTDLGSQILEDEIIPQLTELQRMSLEQLFEQYKTQFKQ